MTTDLFDDKALRKAWLKQRFASFEYHEELVAIHEKWRDVLRRALQRAEAEPVVSEDTKAFRRTYWLLIEKKPRPGDYKRAQWNQYHATGLFRSIPDYSRYLISEGDALGWMTESEHAELGKYWAPMSQMADNIQYTVDDYWFNPRKGNDDMLLDEKYTGPITWPVNWREDILGTLGATSAGLTGLRLKADEPVPQAGLWQSVDTASQQQRANVGDKLPNLGSAYGITIWQRVGD
jgi:hypothetical protein